jgi:DNA-binding NtrC family response regulator
VGGGLDIGILFRYALQTMSGVTVFTFTNPILALKHFQINDFAYVLVISDFKIPRINGMDFLKRIREANRFVRTILMTAFRIDDKMFRQYTKNKIINAFIQKPIGIQDLLKEVDTQLHSYEMQNRFPS